jgi:hypothetical protein
VASQDVLDYQRECRGTSWEAMELIMRKREIEDGVAKERRAVDRRSEEKASAAALHDGPTVDQPPRKLASPSNRTYLRPCANTRHAPVQYNFLLISCENLSGSFLQTSFHLSISLLAFRCVIVEAPINPKNVQSIQSIMLDIMTKCYIMDAHAACMRLMHACLALDC